MYSRELLKGILKPIIIKLLSENKKMYGYQIVQEVKFASDGKILIKEGSLYPALHALVKDGYLQVESVVINNRTRRYYSLTTNGSDQVQTIKSEILDFASTLTTLFHEKAIT